MSNNPEFRLEGEEINLRQVFAGFIDRWKYFVISLAVFLAGGFLYMRVSLPVYEAETS